MLERQELLRSADVQIALSQAALFPSLFTRWDLSKVQGRDLGSACSLRLDQSLFAGGADYAALRTARLKREVDAGELENAQDSVRYEVLTIALAGSLARERLRILKSSRRAF